MWVRTYEKHQETEIRFCFQDTPKQNFLFGFHDTPKWNSVSISETLQNGIPFLFPQHSKMEFCFCFQVTLLYKPQQPRTRSSQRKRIQPMFLPCIAMNQDTSSTVATNIGTTIKATDMIATIANLNIVIKTINALIMGNGTTRTQGTTSPTTRRMIASAITSRKRAMRPCTMTSPLCWVPAKVKIAVPLLHHLESINT